MRTVLDLNGGLAVPAVVNELGLAASTLWRWVNRLWWRRRAAWWAKQVTPVFGFLRGYGFVLTDVQAVDWWDICAVYRAERAALMVVYSVEFCRVEVRLFRAVLLDLPDLSNGRVFVTGVPGLDGHLADGLLEKIYPDAKRRKKIVRSHDGLEPDRVASALEFWAGVMREGAADFLHGDLSILDEWEGRRDRLVVKIHLPRNATSREEAAAFERTRAVFSDADVVATRYPLPEEERSKP